MSINARNKGHNYERKIMNEWKKLGWKLCKTSRYANQQLDAMKVDLVETDPFQVQCKAVEAGINYHKLLGDMPNNDKSNLVFHKRNKKEVVVMDKDTFYKLITKQIKI